MTTMQITVSDSMMRFIQTQAKKLGFASPGEYVAFWLEELAEREKKRQTIEAELPNMDGRSTGLVAFWDELEKVPRTN